MVMDFYFIMNDGFSGVIVNVKTAKQKVEVQFPDKTKY